MSPNVVLEESLFKSCGWNFWGGPSVACPTPNPRSFLGSHPQPFWHHEPVSWKTIFPWSQGLGDVLGFSHHSPPAVLPGS